MKWCGGSGHSDFFSNGNCMQLYKNFANTLISRVNTVNGRVYASGPLRFPCASSGLSLRGITMLHFYDMYTLDVSSSRGHESQACSAGTRTIPASSPGISSMSQDAKSKQHLVLTSQSLLLTDKGLREEPCIYRLYCLC